MTANESWLINPQYSSSFHEIIIANKMKVPVLCSGDVEITTNYDFDITVNNVLCVPSLTTNLLSVSELIKNGNSVVFETNKCLIKNNKGELVAEANLTNGVYKLNLKTQNCLLSSSSNIVNGETWHRRLGHIICINSNDMNKMKRCGLVNGLDYPDTFTISKSDCEICCEGKQSRLPFSTGSRATDVLEIVHSDICGPMETKSIGGARYFLLLIDDYTRMTFVYFLKTKNEVLHYFKEFKCVVEKFHNKNIKILRTDNGWEYCSNDFENYLKSEGIIHQKTNPYTPEQNGLSERSNRTIVERARCLLFDAGLDKTFWAEAANTAVYLKNRSVASGIEKTPYEAWTGIKPNLEHIRIFGSTVMAHIPKEKRTKWDKKSKKHILVGFSENVKGYRIYDPIKRQITTSRDVVIKEKPKKEEIVTVSIENTDSVGDSMVESVVKLDYHSESSSSDLEFRDAESVEYNNDLQKINNTPEKTNDSQSNNAQQAPQLVDEIKEKRQRKKPSRYGVANICTRSTGEDEPTYEDAISGPEKQQWQQAMAEELESFEDNQVWEIVDAPENASVVQCK